MLKIIYKIQNNKLIEVDSPNGLSELMIKHYFPDDPELVKQYLGDDRFDKPKDIWEYHFITEKVHAALVFANDKIVGMPTPDMIVDYNRFAKNYIKNKEIKPYTKNEKNLIEENLTIIEALSECKNMNEIKIIMGKVLKKNLRNNELLTFMEDRFLHVKEEMIGHYRKILTTKFNYSPDSKRRMIICRMK